MRFTKATALMCMLAAVALIIGCGSDNRTPSGPAAQEQYGVDSQGTNYVGAAVCINCHQGFSWSSEIVEEFLESKHVIHSNDVNAASGSACLQCHDPVGDGRSLETILAAQDDDDEDGEKISSQAVPAEGLAAVTCESCHGAGGEHYGVGPLAHPKPNLEACGKCHNSNFSHNSDYPEADNIIEDVKNSQHYNNGIRGEDADGNVRALCSRCHTDEGARKYRYVQGDATALAHFLEDEPLVMDASPIQCRTCHDAHKPGKLLRAATTGNSAASAEFNTCTNCHQTGAINATTKVGDPAIPYHRSGDLPRAERTILDTHFDNASTANIEGYVISRTNNRSCRDCHNVHLANVGVDSVHTESKGTKINRQWAQSKHGGNILTAPTTNGIANVSESEAPAFVHYDFKGANRASCQRCHTSTGFKNYADSIRNDSIYNAASNTFAATGEQREMLYCWACHTDNAGGLRNPGAVTSTYTNAPYTFPDVAGSNVCMLCHVGRESGDTIKNDVTSNFANRSFVNSHYLTAGATIFGASGYEYEGLSYANPSFYRHDQIGTADAEGTGSNGPCAGCHMSGDESNHVFMPVMTDSDGVITEIIANTNVCSKCHTVTPTADRTMTAEEMNEQREGFEAGLEVLHDALAAKGFVFQTNNPYFVNKNWVTADDPTGKRNMGAAFNYNLLYHEPGAYAHNRFYAKRLIFDSIDWMDNGVLNGTIDMSSSHMAHEWMNAAAPMDAVTRP